MGALDLSKVAISMGKVLKKLKELESKIYDKYSLEEFKEEIFGIAYICRVDILDVLDNNSYMHYPLLPIKIPTGLFTSRKETMTSALEITIGKLFELIKDDYNILINVKDILKRGEYFFKIQNMLSQNHFNNASNFDRRFLDFSINIVNDIYNTKTSSVIDSIYTRKSLSVFEMIENEDKPFILFKDSNNKLLFTCGKFKGYVPQNIQDRMLTIDVCELGMKEISINGGQFMTCITILDQPIPESLRNEKNVTEIKYLMNAKELEFQKNAAIKYLKESKTGDIHFSCGNIQGLVHPDLETNYMFMPKDNIMFVEYISDNKITYALEVKSTKLRLIYLSEKKDKSIENTDKNQYKSIKAFNRMSAASLMKSQNSEIQFIENPNNGKIFFICGEIKGYVSPLVVEKMNSVTVDELQYAEVSIDNKPAVPCLMMVDKKFKKVQRTITIASQIEADKRVMKNKLLNAFEENIEAVKEKIDDTIFGDLILTSTIANTYQSLKEQETLKLICEDQNIDFIELLDEAYEEIKSRFINDLP